MRCALDVLVVIAVLLSVSGSVSAAPAPSSGFEIATVRVTYRLEGPGPMRGTSMLWIEDSGGRAAIREELGPATGQPTKVETYWDGRRSHIRRAAQAVARSPFRPIDTEASGMARSTAAERAAGGWTAQGQRTVAGQTCSVWRNNRMGGIELCVWRGLDLQFFSGVQRKEATAIAEGERIPADMVALAN